MDTIDQNGLEEVRARRSKAAERLEHLTLGLWRLEHSLPCPSDQGHEWEVHQVVASMSRVPQIPSRLSTPLGGYKVLCCLFCKGWYLASYYDDKMAGELTEEEAQELI